jgi:lathosterol oxidase
MSELARVFSIMFAADAGRYLVAAGTAFLLVWVWGRARYANRLVRGAWAAAEDRRRELAYSAATAAVFAAVGTAVFYGTQAGVLRVEHGAIATRGWAWFVASIAVLIVAQDTYFYWTHRAMHHRALYRWMHRVHHRSHNPSPWAAYAFSPAEALVHAAFVPLAALVLPFHQIALFLFLAFMIARNVLGHLGVELFPSGFASARATRWSTTTTHHALHHARPRHNYGLYFTWWDRAMATTDPTYELTFARLTARMPVDVAASPR